MDIKKRKSQFLDFAVEKTAEQTSVFRFYQKHLINKFWGFVIEYFLRFIDYKRYGTVVKLDLWEETVAMFTDVRGNILKLLKPKKVYYIEFVKDFCLRFSRLYKTKNEFAVHENIVNWPFRTNSLEAIIDINTCGHLSEKEFDTLLKHYRRTLTKNGYIFLLHINKNYFNIRNFCKAETDYMIRPRSSKVIESFLERNGFKIIRRNYMVPFIFDSSFASNKIYARISLIFSVLMSNIYFYILDFFLSKYENLNIFIGYIIKK